MEIPVLYEDKDYLILNKPAGLVVHSDGKTKESSLADWILEHYPRLKNVGEPIPIADSVIPRPGIVHRLDRDTSGAIVIAKNQVAFTDLKEKFKNREVAKKYHAFVYGVIKEDDGVMDFVTSPDTQFSKGRNYLSQISFLNDIFFSNTPNQFSI